MKLRTIIALLKKEVLNIIRDKKSFVTMILLPILMYPLVIGMMGFIMSIFTKVDDTIYFGINYELSDDFISYMDSYTDKTKIETIYGTNEQLKEKFDNNELGVYVIKNENTYEIHFDENSTSNVATSSIIYEIYDSYSEKHFKEKIESLNIDYDMLKDSFKVERVQESITDMGSLLPSIISMSLVLIVFSNCFSAAVEVSTNEKEKGTLETILSLPVSKTELIISKFLTVLTISFVSGLLSFISLFSTLMLGSKSLSMLGFISFSVSKSTLIIYFLSILLLSILFTGLVLCFTIFSKTLKEAQTSLMPLELVVTLISYLPLFGINASIKSALIPFVNITLLLNNSLSTNIDGMFVIITIVSSVVYAYLLIILVSKIYNQEDILFNTKNLKNISFKSGKGKTIYFTPMSAIIITIISFVLTLYFQLIFISSPIWLVLAFSPITICLVIFISGLLCNFDFKEGFNLKRFKIYKFIKLLILFIACVITSTYLINALGNLFPSLVQTYEGITDIISFDNKILNLVIVAILPGIFEELLFRGVLYNSFKHKFGFIIGMFVSALIFGVYHMNWIQGINAFLMGLVLAYGYYKSGSLFVPILLHTLNNSFAVLSEYIPSLGLFNNKLFIICLLLLSILVIIVMVLNLESYSKKE